MLQGGLGHTSIARDKVIGHSAFEVLLRLQKTSSMPNLGVKVEIPNIKSYWKLECTKADEF